MSDDLTKMFEAIDFLMDKEDEVIAINRLMISLMTRCKDTFDENEYLKEKLCDIRQVTDDKFIENICNEALS